MDAYAQQTPTMLGATAMTGSPPPGTAASGTAATGEAPARPAVGQLLLGAVTLAGERLRLLGPKRTPAVAIVVGLVSEGRDAAARAATRTANQVATTARQADPSDRIKRLLDGAASRGSQKLTSSKDETAQWLRSAVDRPLKWAEQTLIPRVVDDMTPYLVDTVTPRVINGALPAVRTKVVPAIIEDLTKDPRVRIMVAEQSHGAVAAAKEDLREAVARADDRVEAAFRNAFRRNGKA